MVAIDERLRKILIPYDVGLSVSNNTKGKDIFVNIVDGRNELLQIAVQYSDHRIYCVYFLNNQYFEEDDETLYGVVQSILAGSYQVHQRGIFRKVRYIDVSLKTKVIDPERAMQDKEFEATYKLLPIAFHLLVSGV